MAFAQPFKKEAPALASFSSFRQLRLSFHRPRLEIILRVRTITYYIYYVLCRSRSIQQRSSTPETYHPFPENFVRCTDSCCTPKCTQGLRFAMVPNAWTMRSSQPHTTPGEPHEADQVACPLPRVGPRIVRTSSLSASNSFQVPARYTLNVAGFVRPSSFLQWSQSTQRPFTSRASN